MGSPFEKVSKIEAALRQLATDLETTTKSVAQLVAKYFKPSGADEDAAKKAADFRKAVTTYDGAAKKATKALKEHYAALEAAVEEIQNDGAASTAEKDAATQLSAHTTLYRSVTSDVETATKQVAQLVAKYFKSPPPAEDDAKKQQDFRKAVTTYDGAVKKATKAMKETNDLILLSVKGGVEGFENRGKEPEPAAAECAAEEETAEAEGGAEEVDGEEPAGEDGTNSPEAEAAPAAKEEPPKAAGKPKKAAGKKSDAKGVDNSEEIARLKDEIESEKEKTQNVQNELDTAREALKEAEDGRAAQTAAVAALTTDLKTATDALSTLEREAIEHEHKCNAIRKEVIDAEARMNAAIKDRNEFEAKLAASNNERKALSLELGSAAAKLTELEHESDKRSIASAKEIAVAVERARQAEQHRLSEFKAFERATQQHAHQMESMEQDLRDMRTELDAARLERDAMKARLCDQHLRDHIRALQLENNQLRDDRVRLAQQSSATITKQTMEQSSTAEEVQALKEQRAALQTELQVATGRMATLETVLREVRAELTEERSAAMLRSSASASGSPDNKTVATDAPASISAPSTPQKSAKGIDCVSTATSPPRKMWASVAVQSAGDTQAQDIEAEHNRCVMDLSAQLKTKSSELEAALDACESTRQDMEAMLVQSSREKDQIVEKYSQQLKVASYKMQKIQADIAVVNEWKERALTAEGALARKNDELMAMQSECAASKKGSVRESLTSQMEAEALRVKVGALQKQIVVVRDEYEAKIDRIRAFYEDKLVEQTVASNAAALSHAGSPSGALVKAGDSLVLSPGDEHATRLQEIDELLLALHAESVQLDTREANIQQRRDSSVEEVTSRLQWVEESLAFWSGPGRGQSGPNHETADEMLRTLNVERESLHSQLKQIDEGLCVFFREVADVRERLHKKSEALMAERSAASGKVPIGYF